MYTGWLEEEDRICYYLPDHGALALGWQEIGGKLFYFDAEGSMQTGWLKLGEYDYYLHPDGSAAIGPTTIDGNTHYFTPKGIHVVLVNARNKVPSYYERKLVTYEEPHRVSEICLEPLKMMLSDCEQAGISYTFNSAFRSVEQQKIILETRTKEYEDQGMGDMQAYMKARETVALPGTSEHHLGLAVDLLGEEALVWLNEHCWDYGFIVRYAADKQHITGITDEPWHFRYVGTEVSLDMKDSGLCLEEYLGAYPIESEK
jgi:D-alanyl-D-alanine carboxypeptidase